MPRLDPRSLSSFPRATAFGYGALVLNLIVHIFAWVVYANFIDVASWRWVIFGIAAAVAAIHLIGAFVVGWRRGNQINNSLPPAESSDTTFMHVITALLGYVLVLIFWGIYMNSQPDSAFDTSSLDNLNRRFVVLGYVMFTIVLTFVAICYAFFNFMSLNTNYRLYLLEIVLVKARVLFRGPLTNTTSETRRPDWEEDVRAVF